jgi:hypothetical protein
MSMKNSNDTIGSRTRDIPFCSELPQRTAPPRTPMLRVTFTFYILVRNVGSSLGNLLAFWRLLLVLSKNYTGLFEINVSF